MKKLAAVLVLFSLGIFAFGSLTGCDQGSGGGSGVDPAPVTPGLEGESTEEGGTEEGGTEEGGTEEASSEGGSEEGS